MTAIRVALPLVRGCLILLIALSAGAVLQQPQVSSQESDCAKAELRASIAEVLLAAERVKTSTSVDSAQVDSLVKQKSEVEQRLAVERTKAEGLIAASERTHLRLAKLETDLTELSVTIATRTAERDKAQSDAKRARSWKRSFVRVFGKK